jgi:glutathione reductase (NADPH)
VVIAGSGYVAVEFAGIFHGLGADTTLVYRAREVLRGFDDDVRRHLGAELAKKGICLRSESHIICIERRGDGSLHLALAGGGALDCDLVMYATGRVPNTGRLGLDAAGVTVNARGAVIVNEYSQSAVENIYAVGDVTDRVTLTPVAIKEGAAFADTVFGNRPTRADHKDVPTAVFAQPSVASVGLTAEEARAALGDEVDVYKAAFRPLKHTLSGRDEKTLVKLVVDRQTQRVIGAHMVGPDAAEIIQGIAIAVKLGATKDQFDTTVGIHPTAAEEFVTLREKWVEPTEAAG